MGKEGGSGFVTQRVTTIPKFNQYINSPNIIITIKVSFQKQPKMVQECSGILSGDIDTPAGLLTQMLQHSDEVSPLKISFKGLVLYTPL